MPEPLAVVRSLKTLESGDGGWANEAGARRGGTNPTAAAVTLLRQLGMPITAAVGDFLLEQVHPQGGFVAVPGAPMPDLLSTATALHALSGLEVALPLALKEKCLDFVDSLWTNAGGFHGYWSDEELDCEYTFYGLLALGHLAI
jgi:prenyltransferase beta subunit